MGIQFFTSILSPHTIIKKEIEHWKLWLPLFFGLGIGIFFWTYLSLPQILLATTVFFILTTVCIVILENISNNTANNAAYNNSIQLSQPLLSVTSALSSLKYERKWIIVHMILCLAFISGYLRAAQRTESRKAPVIKEETEKTTVTGTIVQSDNKEAGIRVYLKNLTIEGIRMEETPLIVRLMVRTTKADYLEIGDKIKIQAILMPPGMPSIPSGFDFKRFAYFKQIGGIGYATNKPIILSKNDLSFKKRANISEKIKIYFHKVRKNISKRVKNAVQSEENIIITSLLLGEITEMKQKDYDAMKTAGTAHIIAISGMHLVVASFVIFFIIRKLTTYFYFINKNLPIQKIAALATMILTFLYLLLVGCPVSAQRAFITSSLLFLSIIIDRNVDPITSLGLASMVILILEPEMLFNPSFQMSFAACLSIIRLLWFSLAVEKRIIIGQIKKGHRIYNTIIQLGNKLLRYVASLFFISIFASIGAAPFIAHHFNQFSTYSVISNMLCVPISDLIAMPLGIIGIILMPLGLEKAAFIPMSYAINWILKISHYTSSLPFANIHISTFENMAITIFAISFVSIYIANSSIVRYISLIGIMYGLSGVLKNENVDILISGNAKIFAVRSAILANKNNDSTNIKRNARHYQAYTHPISEDKILPSSLQKERYTRGIWKQILGNKFDNKNKLEHDNCNSAFCIIKYERGFILIKGGSDQKKRRSYYNSYNGYNQDDTIADDRLAEFCNGSEFAGKIMLFINMQNDDICKNSLKSINLSDLRKNGTHSIYLREKNAILVKRVSDYIMPRKPWYPNLNPA